VRESFNAQKSKHYFIIIIIGTVVQADIYSIHYDSDLWGPVDPHQFYPERHMTKRHLLAYLPFGVGPRHCAGMRFALLGLRMACVRLLKEFTVLPSDKLKNSFCILEVNTVVPEAVWIRLERRKK
jgi:cytochrome P450